MRITRERSTVNFELINRQQPSYADLDFGLRNSEFQLSLVSAAVESTLRCRPVRVTDRTEELRERCEEDTAGTTLAMKGTMITLAMLCMLIAPAGAVTVHDVMPIRYVLAHDASARRSPTSVLF